MTTPAFLVIALACGGALFLLFWTLVRLLGGPIDTWHRRWLERRLRRRLARGSDHHFEELRSIETALAGLNQAPRKVTPFDRAVQIVAIPLAGIILLRWILPEAARPDWTRSLPPAILLVLAAQWAAGNMSPFGKPIRGARIAGILVVALFSLVLVLAVARPEAAS